MLSIDHFVVSEASHSCIKKFLCEFRIMDFFIFCEGKKTKLPGEEKGVRYGEVTSTTRVTIDLEKTDHGCKIAFFCFYLHLLLLIIFKV